MRLVFLLSIGIYIIMLDVNYKRLCVTVHQVVSSFEVLVYLRHSEHLSWSTLIDPEHVCLHIGVLYIMSFL